MNERATQMKPKASGEPSAAAEREQHAHIESPQSNPFVNIKIISTQRASVLPCGYLALHKECGTALGNVVT